MHETIAKTLLVGFDSAWTRHKRGAIVAVLREEDGTWQELGEPKSASFADATDNIERWRHMSAPTRTFILLDQPTIITNASGQRPVESIVSPAIGRRFGGVQPANTSRTEMFGPTAPIWAFLEAHGNITDPWHAGSDTYVLETYPVLALIALGWLLHDEHAKARTCGRLPKYNPQRRATFRSTDWQILCDHVSVALRRYKLPQLASCVDILYNKGPNKSDQDKLDALISLLVGIHLISDDGCCVIGSTETGLMLVPECASLRQELTRRCTETDRDHTVFIRSVRRRTA